MTLRLIFVLSIPMITGMFKKVLSILWGDEMAFSPADMPSRLGGGDNRINEK